MTFANIMGPDLMIVVAVVALLFGGTQLPKLARGLGSASHEFRKGMEEGSTEAEDPNTTPTKTLPVKTTA